MKRAVLDASAVMAFFEDRPGADKVEELISLAVAGKRDLLMSVVNWGEVYYSVWRAKGQGAAKQAAAEIAQLPVEIVPADFELARLAATFRANHKLPYADCFAAALASDRRALVVTADADFKAIADELQLLFL